MLTIKTVLHKHLVRNVSLLATFVVIAVLAVIFSMNLTTRHRVNATLAGFDAGNIIDDPTMANVNSMNVGDIQNFLNSQNSCNKAVSGAPVTATSSTSAYYNYNSGLTYSIRNGRFLCLANATFDNNGMPTSGNGTSAAQIIYNAAHKFNINPQVLIVLLQKEQGLVTDDWPNSGEYQNATGYGCPDTAPCSTSGRGLVNQLEGAAYLFRTVLNGGWSNYPAYQTTYIQYSPDVSCGGSNVYVQNRATSGLYRYTPYQPNAGAMAAGWGTASCGAYGNRNFYNYFTSWFGSTQQINPPGCDSRITNVGCVWRLTNVNTGASFLTIDKNERDAAIRSGDWLFNENDFYAYIEQVPGSIPVYRINMPNEHFYTTSVAERDSILADSNNSYEGIAFYVLPSSTISNISYPIYRFSGEHGHVLTTTSNIPSGYSTTEGVAFNTPSGMAATPTPTAGRQNIYRINGTEHFYTVSLAERDALLRSGSWHNEGILTEVPIDNAGVPVYRLNGPEHFYTASTVERDALLRSGSWHNEGIAWYIDSETPPVFRFQDNNNGRHFFTSSLSEALSIANISYAYEGVAFGTDQSSADFTPVYRLNGSSHFYTANVNELLSVVNRGFNYEGIAFHASAVQTSNSTPVYRLNGPGHFYTASTVERDALLRSGSWHNEGIAFYASSSPTTTPVYRLNGPGHFYTASTVERDALLRSGSWHNEGIAFYAY